MVTVTIYIYLPDEAVDVWRPVKAEYLGGDKYRIVDQQYDRVDEYWEFEPGDVVICEMISLCGIWCLVAAFKDGSPQIASEGLKERIKKAEHFRRRNDKYPEINKADGNPATRYVHLMTVKSAVIDDVKGTLIHIGGSAFQYGPATRQTATNPIEIYVFLPKEGAGAWKAVQAEHLGGNKYRILDQPYDREDAYWEFEPGDVVVCEMTKLADRWCLGAICKMNSIRRAHTARDKYGRLLSDGDCRKNLQVYINEAIIRGTEERISLLRFEELVRHNSCAKSLVVVQRMTKEVLREVLHQGLMEIGDIRPDAFLKWEASEQDALEKVESDWDIDDPEESWGSICWLQNTAKGNEMGDELWRRIKLCANELLLRGSDDLVQATDVASVAMEVGGMITPEEVSWISIKMIEHVLFQNLMVIEDIANGGDQAHCFELQSIELNLAIERIEDEWLALGRNPIPGEICCLRITDKGRKMAEELKRQKSEP